ncbi:NAD(P)H-binding protein [Streptomyces sp. NBC_01186]|uniref:NAD(P)-dependent oxidoreductase n=1 Tax=unclassified Streptomyces TaxID=2593676 RepID=UPI002DD9B95D|nr:MULTISPECIES: NAD(P)H-binding protein [unclassified Streptomyces]WSB77377.1 NAD(P)H-binding protein [Streptomyces sp. NBC_01775]WSS14358.1 NAD(P)H-binding protein [Streptomyces sp. NBC_01186]
MRLTVFGATGGAGREVVRQAVEAGHEVTAVVRDPARLPVRNDLLRVVTADVRDDEALRPLVAGADAGLSALGSPTNKGVGIASAGTRAILRALQKAGVERYLAVSAAPVGEQPEEESPLFRVVGTPLVRRVFKAVYADLALMEEEIRGSGLKWTLLRPPQLTDKPGTGEWVLREGTAVPRRHSITRADLASAMLAMTGDDATARKVYGVANGPRSPRATARSRP